MGRRAQLPTLARLELSQAVYDEIERKLLEAGHEHRFWRGPGTAIDMTGIWVERGAPPKRTCFTCGAAADPEDVEARNVQAQKVSEQRLSAPKDSRYCFGCDRVVTQPCERVGCMAAANRAVDEFNDTA
jgi:hypothetical protein